MLYPPEMMKSIVMRHGGGFIFGANVAIPPSLDECEGYAVSSDPLDPNAAIIREEQLKRSAQEHGQMYLFVPHEVTAEAQKSHDFGAAVEALMAKHPHIPRNMYFPKGVLEEEDKRSLIM